MLADGRLNITNFVFNVILVRLENLKSEGIKDLKRKPD